MEEWGVKNGQKKTTWFVYHPLAVETEKISD